MTGGHDEVDAWLEREVVPLPPPPGTLDRIRRGARRRKRTQAVLAVAGGAVIAAAAALIPQLAANLSGRQGSPSAAASQSATATKRASASASASATSRARHTYLSTTTSGVAAPPHFRPTSITFAPTGTGSVVGAVIGQAGSAGHCATQYCTSLAGTSDYGASWYGVSAPVTGGPNGSTGVSQLRFVNLHDGWAFGPALWTTLHGGWPWLQEGTGGQRVLALEAAKPPGSRSVARAFAVFADCTGTGSDYAAGCTSFTLYNSVAGSTTWSRVAVPAAFRTMTTATASSAALVIAGGKTAYLLTPSGAVLSGPVAGGPWVQAGQAPCRPGSAQSDGQPTGAQLTSGKTLVLACDSGATAHIYTSTDYAKTWQPAGTVSFAGSATSIASAANGNVVLATTSNLYYLAPSGTSWKPANVTRVPGGFGYVGMTTATLGVAVPERASLGEIFVTRNGGQNWTAARVG